MTPFRELPAYQWGEEFERALSRYLQSHGWGVLPVYDYSGAEDKAPAMHCGSEEGLILPDLFAARAGVTHWVEAKRKTKADWTRRTQQLETGLNLRLYRHYQRVKAQSGIDVWLFFGHETENSVRCVELDAMEPRIYDGDKMGRGGMAFWPWDALIELCALTAMIPAATGEAAA